MTTTTPAPDTPTVYPDGACIGNPRPGGWAWAVPGGAFASGSAAATTNQRMEVQAALEAIRAIEGPLRIVSDSKYVVDCFNQRWYDGWERRDWKNAKKEPVKNQDLWKPLIALYLARRDEITFEWVKGHSGDEMNDVVDRLAVEAARTQGARSGSEPPTDLGEADVVDTGPAPATASAGIAGWNVATFGHRPPQLCGYDVDNPPAADVRSRLRDVLRAWRQIHPDLVVLTGLGLGAEQIAAQACIDEAIPFVAVLPYPDPDKVWPDSSRRRYRTLLDVARSTITLGRSAPSTRQAAGKAAGDRDRWMVGTADAAVVVWDGNDRGLADLVASLERKDVDIFPIPVPITPSGSPQPQR